MMIPISRENVTILRVGNFKWFYYSYIIDSSQVGSRDKQKKIAESIKETSAVKQL